MKLAKSRVHFIGIGGIGMCGLAELLHNMGAKVTGSDLASSATTERLLKIGIGVHIGHLADLVESADVVVHSSAVKSHNVEFIRAREKKIPLIARAEALAELMRLKRGIAIAGTHGKTTTTSLISSMLLSAQMDPTIVVGGRLDVIGSTAQLGQGEWLVAEADESDGSFTRLSPELVVITNIDNDHLDHYKTFENLKKAFYAFASRIPFYGSVVACGDDPVVREVFKDFPKRVLYYGFDKGNDYRLLKDGNKYQIFKKNDDDTEQSFMEFEPAMPGRHNALNATAALVVASEMAMDLKAAQQGISQFAGVDRRFQKIGEQNDILFFDDYGHHPTEICAVLDAFKETFSDRRLVVLFQPHRYSRTQECFEDFKDCFSKVDKLLVLDIYPAGEQPIVGITSENLVQSLSLSEVRHIPETSQALEVLAAELKPKDVFVTLGAGSVYKLGPELMERLKD